MEVDDVGGVAQPRLDIAVDITVDITVDIAVYITVDISLSRVLSTDLVAGLGPHVVEGVGLQSLQVVDAARG